MCASCAFRRGISEKLGAAVGTRLHVTEAARARVCPVDAGRRTSRHARPLFHLPQGCVFASPPRQKTDSRPGGLVLWSRSFTPAASQAAGSSASPVNSLIREALIEGRTAEDKYEKDGYSVKWTFVNDLELIFVVRPPAMLLVPSRSAHPQNVGCIPADPPTHLC